MIVNFFTIEVTPDKQNFYNLIVALGQTHTDASGANIPTYTCSYLSQSLSRYVFCIDSGVDATEICNMYNFTYNYVSSMQIDDSLYCRTSLIGIDANQNYMLFTLITPTDISMSQP